MKKFQNLLFKEVRELVTKQLLVSLLMTMGLFYFIGNLAKSEVKRAAASQKIAVLDLDKSELSTGLLANMKSANYAVDAYEGDKAAALAKAKEAKASLLLVIPQGFGASVAKFESQEIESYTFLRGFSIGGVRNAGFLKAILGAINGYLSNDFLKKKIPDLDPNNIKSPIKTKDFVIVKDKMAQGSPEAVYSFVFGQTTFVPVILMMIIIYSSQMVISAIAMEKQNKTLETLLTVPIKRTSIVSTKMLAAGIVGLASAVIYMFGFKSYMGGVTGGALGQASGGVQGVIQKLGLSLDTGGYLILGVSLFFAIICGLAMAMILGVMAEDFRSAQMLIMPLIFLVMIPYFLSFFADFNTLSLPVKILVWAIPFSHPFLATQNIILGNTQGLVFGIAYMFVFFMVMVVIAARIFSTDRVLTMKLKWGKKKGMTA
jgi:ABC-2 type transport system permease protein